MEEKLVSRLVQVGIRAMNPHQRAQAERFGVEVIEMRQADIVELNPERDSMGIATVAAAKLVKETVACMLAWNQSAM